MFWLYWQEYYNHLLDGGEPSQDEQMPDEMPLYADQAWCVWHPVEGCVHFSENWELVSGVPVAQCQGLQWFDTIHVDDHKTLFELLQRMVIDMQGTRVPEAPYTAECRMVQEDDNWRWFGIQCAFSQVRQDDAHPHITISVQDIQQLMEWKQRAEKEARGRAFAEQGRKDFLLHMSHELRTPLNAILGFSQMIQHETHGSLGSPRYREYVENIRASGESLLSKINSLLDMASFQEGEERQEDSACNLSDILDDVAEIHSHRLFEKGLRIQVERQHKSVALRVDHARMVHAISNLVHNAIEATPEGGAITISESLNRDQQLILRVQDSGRGMSAAQVMALREALGAPEGGCHNPLTSSIGVGLLLVKDVMDEHDGSLRIESRDGEGTTVTLVLPVERILSLAARVQPKERNAQQY